MKVFWPMLMIGCGSSMVGSGLIYGFLFGHWNIWIPFIIIAVIIASVGVYLSKRSK